MNHTTFIRLPLFAAGFLAFAASAQSPAPVQQDATSTSATAASVPAEKSKSDKDLTDNNCLKQTGSRIAPRADKQGRKCVNAPGRAYSKEDLDRTGAIDTAEALRRLDPSVR